MSPSTLTCRRVRSLRSTHSSRGTHDPRSGRDPRDAHRPCGPHSPRSVQRPPSARRRRGVARLDGRTRTAAATAAHRRIGRLLRDDSGMSTVEYAIGCVAAAAFAAVLYTVLSGDSVVTALTQLVQRALTARF